jgi:transposase
MTGTEIRHKNGHYYVYKVEGYYDKAAKKPKSRSLGCIGQIYENIGFVPNSKNASHNEFVTKEYGATKIVMSTSEMLLSVLRKCFPSEFMRIYVLAVLKLLGNLSAKDIDAAYGKSAISVMFPKLHLSRNTVSDFLCKLSQQREGMLKFMKKYAGCENGSIIFDGSSFISSSQCNPFCEKGYSPGNIGKSQIRLIYAYDRTNRLPVYFRVAPGSTSDKAVFEAVLDEIGCKGHVIVLDKGFFSKKNIRVMLEAKTDFIIPLQKNTIEVAPERKKFSAYELETRNVFSYHKRIIYFAEFIPNSEIYFA